MVCTLHIKRKKKKNKRTHTSFPMFESRFMESSFMLLPYSNRQIDSIIAITLYLLIFFFTLSLLFSMVSLFSFMVSIFFHFNSHAFLTDIFLVVIFFISIWSYYTNGISILQIYDYLMLSSKKRSCLSKLVLTFWKCLQIQ